MLLVKDEQHPGSGTKLTVAPLYRDIILQKTDDGVLVSPLIDSGSCSFVSGIGHRAFTSDLRTVIPQLHHLRTRSLLLFKSRDLSTDSGDWLSFHGAKFLRVLDLEGAKIKKLPDQVGDLSHLTYLGLKQTDISELPAKLGNLRLLQTLDIRWCGNLTEVPIEVLNLVRLRHLKMFKSINVSGIKLPKEIRRLTNLLTLTGVHAGGGIAEELSNLIRLRRLGVMDLSEENITELFASIMKMQDLQCLSLEVNKLSEGSIVLPELFSPPSRIRKLRLEGQLGKIPTWVGSMESVTIVRLGFSNLVENPMLVLQVLPNLKKLTLWQAYDAKKLGKEFCRAGGFLKLEDLSIASRGLEEWSELEEGALPSLEYLHFHNCSQLKMLPEGLQFITTLKQLDLLPLLDDHMERLKPDGGEENYKIRHIPSVTFLPVSVLRNKFSEFMQSAQT